MGVRAPATITDRGHDVLQRLRWLGTADATRSRSPDDRGERPHSVPVYGGSTVTVRPWEPEHGILGRRPRRHRRRRPGRGDRLVRRHVRARRHARGDQRGAGRARGDAVRARRRRRARSSCSAPLRPGLGDRQVPRPQRPGHPADGLPGGRHRGHLATRCGPRACGCSTTSRAAARPDSRINFVHPKDAGGVLVELVERRARETAH